MKRNEIQVGEIYISSRKNDNSWWYESDAVRVLDTSESNTYQTQVWSGDQPGILVQAVDPATGEPREGRKPYVTRTANIRVTLEQFRKDKEESRQYRARQEARNEERRIEQAARNAVVAEAIRARLGYVQGSAYQAEKFEQGRSGELTFTTTELAQLLGVTEA